MIIILLKTIFNEAISNWLGEYNFCVKLLINFIIGTQPLITTLTQIYEWESIVLIILEQEDETMEETQFRMEKPETKDKFKAKEKTLAKYFAAAITVDVVVNVL